MERCAVQRDRLSVKQGFLRMPQPVVASLSLRSIVGAVLFAVVLAGCPSDPQIVDGDAGAAEGGPATEGGAIDTDGGAADAADAFTPPMCGRLTTLCGSGEKCNGSADCVSKICFGGTCQVPAPADGVKNGDETDVDCGGTMSPACIDGKACLAKTDCVSGVCTTSVCQVPSPTDTVQNGDETGVDCGGSKAPKCPAGSGCLTNADCNLLKCDTAQKKCLPASHTDGIKNDGETGTDCGGAAPTKCATGEGCVATSDCNAVACDVGATNLCLPPTHTDGIKNLGETGTDCGGAAPLKCATGQGCVATSDCNLVLCDVGATNLCLAATHADGIKNLGETGIDCGGAALPLKCPVGEGCAVTADCNNVKCNAGTLKCDPASGTDGIKNGTETDIDCGGGAPTNAKRCAVASACSIDGDCASTACNYALKCVEALSCKVQHGGDTCGSAGTESCCKSAVVGAVNLDKFNITAGRFRAFVNSLPASDMRTWLTAHKPADWPANWTAMLPTKLDNLTANPDFTGIYQELGPNVHPPASVGANEGCFIDNFGARTYRLPDATNSGMSDPQYFTQAQLDDRSLNCVTAPMLAAFCIWDGGRLATKEVIDVAWGAGKYPWGDTSNPLGYQFVWPTDPKGVGFQKGAYVSFQGGAGVPPPLSQTDLGRANYNFNYWGVDTKVDFPPEEKFDGKSCTVLKGALGMCPWRDYSIYVAPPGRFPGGNSATGHADLAGNVFNAVYPSAGDPAATLNGTNAYWSRSGSWQGHDIPWTPKGSWLNVPASYKYWAMGGRCTR
jgi:hypothetical protein